MREFYLFSIFTLFLLLNACGLGHPPFDSEIADTENNRFHYEHLVNVKISPDVVNLYTEGNEIGIDASYCLAFECNNQTASQIIKANKLKQDDNFNVWLGHCGKDWWNKQEIETLSMWIYKSADERYFKCFWYNESNQHAYFLDFDL